MSPFRLDGKVAVITGAAGMIGSATARLFATQGARLFLTDLDSSKVEALAAEIGAGAVSWSTDLTQVSSCQALIDKTVNTFGQLNILVNNVGVCPRVPFLSSPANSIGSELCQSIRRACSSVRRPPLPIWQSHSVALSAPLLLPAAPGAVANASIYSGTKGAIIALTKAFARELAPDVRVNAVAPGAIDTPMVRALAPERLAALIETIPLKRLGSAEEIAAAMLFLAADTCRYMTGATIDINGGWMML